MRPESSPSWVRWFRYARQLILFLMGLIVMAVGLLDRNARLLVVGMITAGVLPLDDVMRMFARPRRTEPEAQPDVS